jgi:DNA repair exonuclease SbcCD nuclease subunit
VLEAGAIDPSFFIGWQLALVGHYHRHCSGKYPGGEWVITGSPLQIDFSEEGEDKGFLVINTDEMSWEFVKIESPRFETIRLPEQSDLIDSFKNSHIKHYIRYIAEDSAYTLDMLKSRVTDEGNPWTFVPKVDSSSEIRIDIKPQTSLSEMSDKYVNFAKPVVGDLDKLKRIGEKYLSDSL